MTRVLPRTLSVAAVFAVLVGLTSCTLEVATDAPDSHAGQATLTPSEPQLTPADPDPIELPEPQGSGAEQPAAAGTALAALDALPVKGRAPKTGYNRTEKFGSAWLDVDHNGCDTRNDILIRDLTNLTLEDGCKVLSGTLLDPYTGTSIDFERGQETSWKVQIDHVVALSDAWQKGAQGLTQVERVELANDPLNLLASDGPTNGAKSDSDAASWLPPERAFRCSYVARQIAVKTRYELWVSKGEGDAMRRVLETCPAEPLPR